MLYAEHTRILLMSVIIYTTLDILYRGVLAGSGTPEEADILALEPELHSENFY